MDLWVFGYGSLLWDPGFVPAETAMATLSGYHRSFCMLSIHYRGTEAEPGLVLALDVAPAATCTGMAFRLNPANADEVMAALRARELISYAYREEILPVTLADGRRVDAIAYVINRDNNQYCQFGLETQAQIIARATGARGPNRDYLFNTAAQFATLGIHDPDMDWLVTRVRALTQPDAKP